MKKTLHHTVLAKFALCLVGFAVLLTGCAVYPAVQVAGGALTGYDAVVMADDYLPRDGVKGGEICGNTDTMLQRRLRERLKLNNMPTVSAHVIDRHAYLVGQFPDRNHADFAVDTARTVQGLKFITCKFYPHTTLHEAENDSRLLATLTRRFGETPRLKSIDLRVEVIRGNAILIGSAGDYGQKTAAVAIAHAVGGVRDVIDYIMVRGAAKPENSSGEKVALK